MGGDVRRFMGGLALSALLLLTLLASRSAWAAAQDDTAVAQGGCAPSSSPHLAGDPRLEQGEITFCAGGDRFQGTVVLGPFVPDGDGLSFLVAGYPDQPGVDLVVRSVAGGTEVPLTIPRVGDRWDRVTVPVPAGLAGQVVEIVAHDRTSAQLGWVGLGRGPPLPLRAVASRGLQLLWLTGLPHLWLCALALALPSAWSVVRRSIHALLGLGLASFLVFWVTFFSSRGGPVMATAILILPFALAARRLARSPAARDDLRAIHCLVLPGWILALLILWIGLYPLTWNGTDFNVPATRWRTLPLDNWISLRFADMLAAGEMWRPLLGDWLTSDRPPLQTGLTLLFRPVAGADTGWAYQALSTWAQTLVLVPLAVLLEPVQTPVRRGLMLVVAGLSSVLIVNGLFVWPKLFAASYCAAYHWLVVGRDADRRDLLRDAAAGVAAGLVLLSHGGAIFALIGSTVAYLWPPRRVAVLRTARIAVASILLYAPWGAYQRLVDPPGDRLLKWHFAGHVDITPEPLFTVLRQAYGELGFGQWLAIRWSNVETPLQGTVGFFEHVGNLLTGSDGARAALIEQGFFYSGSAMWFFGPVLVLPVLAFVLWRRGLGGDVFPRGLLLATVVSLASWNLIIFRAHHTILHEGAYFTYLAGLVLAMLVVARAGPRLFTALAIGNVALALVLYAFDRVPHEHPVLYVFITAALVVAFGRACLAAFREETTP